MRTRRTAFLVLLVVITACGTVDEDQAESTPSTPVPTRTAAGETAGCTDGAPHHAVCWFIKSLRLEDYTGFSELEREAQLDAGILPEGEWYVASCEDQGGKNLYVCRVAFGGRDIGVFEVVPLNSTKDKNGYYVPPEEPAGQYAVLQYRGSVPLG